MGSTSRGLKAALAPATRARAEAIMAKRILGNIFPERKEIQRCFSDRVLGNGVRYVVNGRESMGAVCFM